MTVLKAAPGFLTPFLLLGCVTGQLELSGEIKCRNLEGDALCPKLSHLETGITASPADDWGLRLAYDFAQARKVSWYDSLDLYHLDLPPEKSWLSDYGVRVALDERWSLSVEDTDGTTLIPDRSHLAFAHNLQDAAWKQAALQLAFMNPEIFEADLLLGLGEGERIKADDSEVYFGLRARWTIARTLGLQFAYSEDKNALNKDALFWLSEKSDVRKGFQNQRFAASLILNGKFPFARGLEASFGYQRNRWNAKRPSGDSFSPIPGYLALDPTEALSQMLGGLGESERQTIYYSVSYRILAEYVLGIHGTSFRGDLSEPVLISCQGLDDNGTCVGTTDKYRSFRVNELTYGVGKLDDRGWSVLLEGHEERYDRLYQNFHFRNGRSPRQKNMRLIQARIAWNW